MFQYLARDLGSYGGDVAERRVSLPVSGRAYFSLMLMSRLGRDWYFGGRKWPIAKLRNCAYNSRWIYFVPLFNYLSMILCRMYNAQCTRTNWVKFLLSNSNSFFLSWTISVCSHKCCGVIRLWLENQLQSRMFSQVLSDHKLWPWVQSCWRRMASFVSIVIFVTPVLMRGDIKGLHSSGHWHTIRCGSGLGRIQPFLVTLNVGLARSILTLGWGNAIGSRIFFFFWFWHGLVTGHPVGLLSQYFLRFSKSL